MSPIPRDGAAPVAHDEHDPFPVDPHALVLEAWAQGYMVGSLIIMSFITFANMRRGVNLHKLILIELILGLWQGFWLFPPGKSGRWWLSVAAIPLNVSWWLHNFIAWMKVKPFLNPTWSKVFLGTVITSAGYWVLEIYANFTYFNGKSELFKATRPLELLFRDPWWITSTIYLLIVIKTQYELTLKEVVDNSPRFGVMLAAMFLSIAFVILDVLSVTGALKIAGTTGINPFWKLSFVFKCLTDSVILDDFKTALDRLRNFKLTQLGSLSAEHGSPHPGKGNNLVSTWEAAARDARKPSIQLAAASPKSTPKAEFEGTTNFPGFQNPLSKENEPQAFLAAPDLRSRCSRFESFDIGHLVTSAIEDPPVPLSQAAFPPKDEHHKQPGNGRRESDAEYALALRDMSSPTLPEKVAAPSTLRQQS